MAVRCPKCKTVFDPKRPCPKCGVRVKVTSRAAAAQPSKKSNKGLILGASIAAGMCGLALLGWMVFGGSKKPKPVASAQPTAQAPTPPPAIPSLPPPVSPTPPTLPPLPPPPPSGPPLVESPAVPVRSLQPLASIRQPDSIPGRSSPCRLSFTGCRVQLWYEGGTSDVYGCDGYPITSGPAAESDVIRFELDGIKYKAVPASVTPLNQPLNLSSDWPSHKKLGAGWKVALPSGEKSTVSARFAIEREDKPGTAIAYANAVIPKDARVVILERRYNSSEGFAFCYTVVENGKLLKIGEGEFRSEGKFCVVIGSDKHARVSENPEGPTLCTFDRAENAVVLPGRSQIVVQDAGRLSIHALPDGKKVRALEGPKTDRSALLASVDGNYFAAIDMGSVRIFDAETAVELARYEERAEIYLRPMGFCDLHGHFVLPVYRGLAFWTPGESQFKSVQLHAFYRWPDEKPIPGPDELSFRLFKTMGGDLWKIDPVAGRVTREGYRMGVLLTQDRYYTHALSEFMVRSYSDDRPLQKYRCDAKLQSPFGSAGVWIDGDKLYVWTREPRLSGALTCLTISTGFVEQRDPPRELFSWGTPIPTGSAGRYCMIRGQPEGDMGHAYALVDVSEGKCMIVRRWTSPAALSSDGRIVIETGRDGSVRLTSVGDGSFIYAFDRNFVKPLTERFTNAVSPDGRYLALQNEQSLMVLDLERFEAFQPIPTLPDGAPLFLSSSRLAIMGRRRLELYDLPPPPAGPPPPRPPQPSPPAVDPPPKPPRVSTLALKPVASIQNPAIPPGSRYPRHGNALGAGIQIWFNDGTCEVYDAKGVLLRAGDPTDADVIRFEVDGIKYRAFPSFKLENGVDVPAASDWPTHRRFAELSKEAVRYGQGLPHEEARFKFQKDSGPVDPNVGIIGGATDVRQWGDIVIVNEHLTLRKGTSRGFSTYLCSAIKDGQIIFSGEGSLMGWMGGKGNARFVFRSANKAWELRPFLDQQATATIEGVDCCIGIPGQDDVLLVTSEAPQEMRRYSTITGEELGRIRLQDQFFTDDVVPTADGRYLATIRSELLTIVDASTGKFILQYRQKESFSPPLIAFPDGDGFLLNLHLDLGLWKPGDKAPRLVPKARFTLHHSHQAFPVGDGKSFRLFSGHLYTWAYDESAHRVSFVSRETGNGVAANNTWLVRQEPDLATLVVYKLPEMKRTREIKIESYQKSGMSSFGTSVAFLRRDDIFVPGKTQGDHLNLYRTSTHEGPIRAIKPDPSLADSKSVYWLEVSGDYAHALLQSDGGSSTSVLIDISGGVYRKIRDLARGSHLLSDGTHLVIPNGTGGIKIVNAQDNALVHDFGGDLEMPERAPLRLALSPSGRYFAIGNTQEVVVFDLKDKILSASVPDLPADVLCFLSETRLILATSPRVEVYDLGRP